MTRRRKRRRKAQGSARIGATGLRALARRSPHEAAAALEAARRGKAGARLSHAELEELTLFTAGQLRNAHDLDRARSLLGTVTSSSPRAELERALLAFAAGDDATVEEVARRSPALTPILAPLVATVRGESVKRSPNGAPESLRALYGAARALGTAIEGDDARATRTAASIRSATVRSRAQAACRLAAERGTLTDAKRLVMLSDPELTGLARIAHARSEPELTLDSLAFAHSAEFDRTAADAARHHALATLALVTDAAQLEPMALAALGPDAFERPADAALRLGFCQLAESQWEEAAQSFDEARAGGADLAECLRGRWLARRGGNAPRAIAAFGEAASSYARALADDPRHAAARIAVQLDHAMARVAAGIELEEASAQVASARAATEETWLATRGLEASIDRAEARVHIARGELEPARALSRRALHHAPRISASWELALELAPQEERARIRGEAAEATGNPAFGSSSESTSGRSLGRIARALVEAPLSSPDADIALLDEQAADLSETDRTTLDIGALHLLAERHGPSVAGDYLERRLAHSRSVADLLIAGLTLDLVDPVRAFFEHLVSPDDPDELADVVMVAYTLHGPSLGDVLLGRLAPQLSHRALSQLRKHVRRAHDIGAARLDEVFERAHQAFHPELCLDDILEGERELGDAFDEEDEEGVPFDLDELLAPLVTQFGIPRRTLRAIPPERKLAFIETVMHQMDTGRAPTSRDIDAALTALLGQDQTPRRSGSTPKKKKKRKRRR